MGQQLSPLHHRLAGPAESAFGLLESQPRCEDSYSPLRTVCEEGALRARGHWVAPSADSAAGTGGESIHIWASLCPFSAHTARRKVQLSYFTCIWDKVLSAAMHVFAAAVDISLIDFNWIGRTSGNLLNTWRAVRSTNHSCCKTRSRLWLSRWLNQQGCALLVSCCFYSCDSFSLGDLWLSLVGCYTQRVVIQHRHCDSLAATCGKDWRDWNSTMLENVRQELRHFYPNHQVFVHDLYWISDQIECFPLIIQSHGDHGPCDWER